MQSYMKHFFTLLCNSDARWRDVNRPSALSSNEDNNIRIMFVSHEKNVGKKTFQKPNILRRKTKISIPKSNIPNVNESLETRSPSSTIPVQDTNISDNLDKSIKLEASYNPTNVEKEVWKLTLPNNSQKKDVKKSQESDVDANINSNVSICRNITQIKNVDKSFEHSSLNIESFINGGGSEQIIPLPNLVAAVSPEKKTTQAKTKWCFDITNNSMDIIINNYREPQLGELEQKLDSVIIVPSVQTSDDHQQPEKIHDQMATLTQSISVDCYSNRAVKFKCDHPNCTKGFWSEEKLRKHKNSHNRPVVRSSTQVTIECPVKKQTADGSEERCPRTFQVRGELLKHLNEDHTLEDAQHRCGVCGRRFFWASGLRAHGASVCARGGLACGWPGCGRVFRLPCRLREHARAHTGDRPYLCSYPDCGWAFRSASKLVRHARRHTDERRHSCTACGRAFLRREHLRDHFARHHQPTARATHLCTHPGCEQTFTNMSTLYMHMKKVHRKEKDSVASIAVAAEQVSTVTEDNHNIYLVSLVAETSGTEEDASAKVESTLSSELGAERDDMGGAGSVGSAGGEWHVGSAGGEWHAGRVGGEWLAGRAGVEWHAGRAGGEWHAGRAGGEWHAARTHCTWPLPRHALPHYVLDDDTHVERTEGSSSDVYTVRSDLFLHGNVPIDEDSQQIVGGEGAPLDADLCLIDAHPTIDLMQEELMYEDAAVDESSFRVFLMNGEELT